MFSQNDSNYSSDMKTVKKKNRNFEMQKDFKFGVKKNAWPTYEG